MNNMIQAKCVFEENISRAKQLDSLYQYLSNVVMIPESFEDLLRAQMVYSLSAFDRLIHDLIRIGMVQIFIGARLPTAKYQAEAIPIKYLPQLILGSSPPPEIMFQDIVREKLSKASYQDPDKIADGLSLIWDENEKWQKIACGLGMTKADVRQRQKLIASRRNAIVHEADLDAVTNTKQAINLTDAQQTSDFLLKLGCRIFDLVELPLNPASD